MPIHVTWLDIFLRLGLAALAGCVIGWDRGEAGKAAGLRTTLLVCLAAALAMIQANLLNDSLGKTGNSFAVMDTMRLPLGILSGMGFIGGGAILRRGKMVVGVTTAATLWFVTVIGLCFGGGQLGLGLAGLALGIIVLAGLKQVERRMPRQRRGWLSLEAAEPFLTEIDVKAMLQDAGCTIMAWNVTYARPLTLRKLHCELRFPGHKNESLTPALVGDLAARPGVRKVSWKV